MTPDKLISASIKPAAAELTAMGIPTPPLAQRFMLTIALQESRLAHRRQVTNSGLEDGPAVSFWQFEKGGGCRGVLAHPLTKATMLKVCELYNVLPTEQGLWDAMRYNDVVAGCAARLFFYTLPDALPTTAAEAWAQYLRVWKPGKPRPDTWDANWSRATEML